MARAVAVTAIAAVLLLLAVSSAFAQPCIECKDCKTNNCYKNCQAKCPVKVDGDKCKRDGREFGKKVAKEACDTTRTYCNGGTRPGSPRTFGGIGEVTKRQCANIFYGACQQQALDKGKSPCGRDFNGFRECNKKTFMDFYTGEVNERCGRQAATIPN